MKTLHRSMCTVALLVAVISPAQSAELKLPREGWVSWQVAAVENAPAWCCWSDWRRPGCLADGLSTGRS